jgi:Glyoxalase/Bleomycin resistance protein/Dioxygenase superfamily
MTRRAHERSTDEWRTAPVRLSSFLNLRVADIEACYREWKAKGAEFVTEPIDRVTEVRCYMRDPDGYLIEVGQATGILEGKFAKKAARGHARLRASGRTPASESSRFARHSWDWRVYPRGAVERARATWTDERLDDLSKRVDDGFNRLDARIDAQAIELARRMDALEGRLGSRIDGLQRTMIQIGGATIATVLATLATVIART